LVSEVVTVGDKCLALREVIQRAASIPRLERGQDHLSPLSIPYHREIKPRWECLISLKALDGLACYHCCRIGGDTSPDSGGPDRMVDDHHSDRGRHSLGAC
jgi:hypothetical protein